MKHFKPRILLALFLLGLGFVQLAMATSNIVTSPTTSRWAWNDVIAWIDFYNDNNGANILETNLQGYASSSMGEVALDCATSPAGNICDPNVWKVLNDSAGRLSGWAWNDVVGWISFCGGQSSTNCPGSVSYRVLVSGATGDFSGYAWNDAVGWISFNCVGPPDHCNGGTTQYKVATTWTSSSTTGYLDSSTFDTGVSGGAQINSVSWQGSMPVPTDDSFVAFQFAASNSSSGPWDYQGPDGTANTYYPLIGVSSPNVAIPVSYTLHNNLRYFRYRMTLASNQAQTFSPRVDNVSVNWSR